MRPPFWPGSPGFEPGGALVFVFGCGGMFSDESNALGLVTTFIGGWDYSEKQLAPRGMV